MHNPLSRRPPLGQPVLALVHPDDRDRVRAILGESATTEPGIVTEFKCRPAHESGSWRHVEVTHANHLDDPAVGGFVDNIRDITEQVEIADRLTHQALHDGLTGLPNRALFLDRLEQSLARAQRHGTTYALFYLDLDRFKTINDSLGHLAGDRLLVVVAERLSECTRAEDTVARLGGDEFVVLSGSACGEQDAIGCAERMRSALARPVVLEDETVGVSIGIAFADTQNADTVLREAVTAMYRPKDRGRNRWEIYNRTLRTVARHDSTPRTCSAEPSTTGP